MLFFRNIWWSLGNTLSIEIERAKSFTIFKNIIKKCIPGDCYCRLFKIMSDKLDLFAHLKYSSPLGFLISTFINILTCFWRYYFINLFSYYNSNKNKKIISLLVYICLYFSVSVFYVCRHFFLGSKIVYKSIYKSLLASPLW